MVEYLLKRKYQSSLLRPPVSGLTKSMVETEASAERVELTEDMAAERMATMISPFSKFGMTEMMKIGKM